jgi:C4-dicarboxylate-specific signal transduction histidine kinase
MVDSTNVTTNLVPPKIQIQSVRANSRELVGTGEATVRPGKGELEIHYAGISYIAPQKIRYRYKLDGYDVNWVEADIRRSAFYTNLRPGKYTFHVLACNEDGVWGATGADFAVELLPYFYQTAWFYVVMGALVLVALSGIYAWRMRHLRRKQRRLQEANDLLESKVRERTGELAKTNTSLKGEIEERKRVEAEIQRIHRQLLDASRMAGQAEVASSVLHNVGNVLNSVNVSTALVRERLRMMRLSSLAKAAQMMQDHAGDLASFLTNDAKGSHLPKYLEDLSRHLGNEQSDLLTELDSLSRNVEHINEIVAMQQNYAKVLGVVEKVSASDLVESAFKVQVTAYERQCVNLVRDYENVPVISADRHKVLQILINIFSNAKYACDQNQSPKKEVVVRIRPCGRESVLIEISDNGIGIAPENLTSIFSHGFTTKKDGHGFGLHSAALAAKEMGGTLTAHSEGLGKGATFSLELPCNPASMKESQVMPSFAEVDSP